MAVDVDAGATLGAMQEGIARQTGIVMKQQRLIILGASDNRSAYQASHWRKPCCSAVSVMMSCGFCNMSPHGL